MRSQDALREGLQQHPLVVELNLARLQAGIVQDVVDQFQHQMGGLLRHRQVVALGVAQLGAQAQIDHAHEAVQRRSDFMAHAGQELGLGGMRLLSRLCPLLCLRLGLVQGLGLTVGALAQQNPQEAQQQAPNGCAPLPRQPQTQGPQAQQAGASPIQAADSVQPLHPSLAIVRQRKSPGGCQARSWRQGKSKG